MNFDGAGSLFRNICLEDMLFTERAENNIIKLGWHLFDVVFENIVLFLPGNTRSREE